MLIRALFCVAKTKNEGQRPYWLMWVQSEMNSKKKINCIVLCVYSYFPRVRRLQSSVSLSEDYHTRVIREVVASHPQLFGTSTPRRMH